jgi:hypothetical protein
MSPTFSPADVARTSRPLSRAVAAAAAWLLLCALGGAARAIDVATSATVVGSTPERIGYNSGHFAQGSNAAAWWKYSGVNGARVWATPSVVEGTDDNVTWGDGVATQQQFLDRRAALRANPLSTAFINWPHFENRYSNNPTSPLACRTICSSNRIYSANASLPCFVSAQVVSGLRS